MTNFFKVETLMEADQLTLGTSVLCKGTAAERDFAPVHTFIYCAEITVPDRGVWPFAAILDGYPEIRGQARADINVT